MIRNLKVLIAAAMALTALGVVGASSAHAADEFHCSIFPCTLTLKPDGTSGVGGTTAHHVFVIKGLNSNNVKTSVSFTCDQITGDQTITGNTASEITFQSIVYDTCKVVGENVTVTMNSCDYKLTALNGTPASGGSQVHLECSTLGDGIELDVNGTACVKITPLTTTGPGIKYHDAVTPAKKEEITAEVAGIGVPAAAVDLLMVGSLECKPINLKTVEEATYTTGNTIITGENPVTGVMANAWYE